jgi:hypothetical protein
MKDDICELFDDFYVDSLDIKRLNYGPITLLPKVKMSIGSNNLGTFIFLIACISGSLSC